MSKNDAKMTPILVHKTSKKEQIRAPKGDPLKKTPKGGQMESKMAPKWHQNEAKINWKGFQNGFKMVSTFFQNHSGLLFLVLSCCFTFCFAFSLFSESFSNTVQRATRSGARPQNFAYESSCFRFVKRVEDSLTWNALPAHLLRQVC